MARLEFWISPTDSITWHLAAQPLLGTEVVLGDRGVFRVTSQHQSHDPKATAYNVEFVREPTLQETKAAAIALNELRISGGWD